MYELAEIMASTIDAEDEKNYCRQQMFYALNILIKKSRKVYFKTYEQMLDCLTRILEL